MPYIPQENRPKFDDLLDQALNKIENHGELNYVISTMAWEYVLGRKLSYTEMQHVIGTLECVKQEMYRRMLSPYEDKKIEENGDILDNRLRKDDE
jgi:hypothetical protein